MKLIELLQQDQRICFFGDSVTATGEWIMEIVEHLHKNYSDLRILPFNCGIPGDNVKKAFDRVYSDCCSLFPSCVVVMFGLNDIGRDLYSGKDNSEENNRLRKEKLDAYSEYMDKTVKTFINHRINVILCTPTPYDIWQQSDTENLIECNDGLSECRQIVYSLAKRYGLPVVDFMDKLTRFIISNPQKMIIDSDRVHPNKYGHHLMAQIFLKALGFIEEIDYEEWESTNKSNQERYDLEQILIKISFVDWCINDDIRDDWLTSNRMIENNINVAKSWGNEFINQAIETYLLYKNQYSRLKGELIRKTITMYGKR
ncbi:MAG: hypothetical protein GX136_08885 [Clostridiales bacterium]|jgi:hypothetical protein|nr:hypothetical protein [Clostridiales bacterium]